MTSAATPSGRSFLSLAWEILRLGLPILIGQLGMIVVGFADTKMVGLYSTDALASASFVNNLFNTALFACMGFTYGITPLVGALYAQRRSGEIGGMMRAGVIANTLFTAILIVIMTLVYLNLEHLHQPEHLLPLIRPYFLLYIVGLLPVSLFNVFAQWSYAINRTRMPMWIILTANATNIMGNWVLIYGHWGAPELGLIGAGLSTLLARLICMVSIVVIFFCGSDYKVYAQGFMRGIKGGSHYLRTISHTSWPISLQMTFEAGSFSAGAVMAGWLGACELASFQILMTIGTLGFCVYYSMASAESVLVANAAGIGDRRLMRRTAYAGYAIILTLAATACCIFAFGATPIIEQFTDDGAVTAMSMTLIVPLLLYQFADSTQITFANALRGTANVMPMLWIAFVSYVVVGLPATYLLGIKCGFGIYGIMLSFTASLTTAAILFFYFFMRDTKGSKACPSPPPQPHVQ